MIPTKACEKLKKIICGGVEGGSRVRDSSVHLSPLDVYLLSSDLINCIHIKL